MSKEASGLRPEDLSRAIPVSEAVARYHRSLASGALPDFPSLLRYKKKKYWLEIAVPSLVDGADPEGLCKAWSDHADEILKETFDQCFSGEIALFALGKLGAGELNLSSDVDLLIIAKEERPEDLSALRKFQKILSEVTPEGFVFRVDFDLRPGGRMGPLIPTVDHFVDYYGNYGETWERMAFVRLRAVAGSPAVRESVLEFSTRFSFRKHLDYTLFEELKLMRRKIHAEHWKRGEGNAYDLKLGVGGIRDVELFFHALQVIHGGKDASLRSASTSAAAKLLSSKKLLPPEDADFLVRHYWDLRALENFVQAKEDHQTHRISKDEPHLPALLKKKLDGLEEDLKRTDAIVATLLGEAPRAPSDRDIRALFEEQKLQEHLQEILAIPLLSRHKERDERTRRAFLQKFLQVAQEQNADASLALDQLKDFLKAVRAKSTFFNLLLREERLLREIAWLFGHSRYLGRLLCFRPELLDSFVFRNQDLKTRDLEILLEALAEKKLLNEIIEGSRFLKTHDVPSMTQALTESADSIVVALTNALRKDHPSEASVLALGKWGAEETGFRSDLDLVFVHPEAPQEADLRFAKRVISRLTDPHRGGSIYPVDVRLRPSGKAGPLVIAWADLRDYLENQAAPWERQAYLRGRWVGRDLGEFKSLLWKKPLTDEDLKELNRIRLELLPKGDVLDLKYSEGGLLDLELFAQTRALLARSPLLSGNTLSLLSTGELSPLKELYVTFRQIEQTLQLISLESTAQISEESEISQLLAASLNIPSKEALFERIRDLLERSREGLVRLDPRRHAR